MTNSDKFGADAKLLEVSNLAVEFDTYGGVVQAVRGVSFSVSKGKTLAIVGESGCGKSVSVQSMMGLIPVPPGRITSGSALLNGKEILGQTTVDGKEIRGADIGMIFQDPMTSLNPTMTIGDQIAEPLQVHRGFSYKGAFEEAVRLLDKTISVRIFWRYVTESDDCNGDIVQAINFDCRRAHNSIRCDDTSSNS